MFVKFGAVVIYTPAFIVPAILIAIAGGWLGNIYLKAQLSVKREMSNAKSPVLAILGGAISGLSESQRLWWSSNTNDVFCLVASIRAYDAQEAFKKETMTRVNSYVRAARVFYNLNRSVSHLIHSLPIIDISCVDGSVCVLTHFQRYSRLPWHSISSMEAHPTTLPTLVSF